MDLWIALLFTKQVKMIWEPHNYINYFEIGPLIISLFLYISTFSTSNCFYLSYVIESFLKQFSISNKFNDFIKLSSEESVDFVNKLDELQLIMKLLILMGKKEWRKAPDHYKWKQIMFKDFIQDHLLLLMRSPYILYRQLMSK